MKEMKKTPITIPIVVQNDNIQSLTFRTSWDSEGRIVIYVSPRTDIAKDRVQIIPGGTLEFSVQVSE